MFVVVLKLFWKKKRSRKREREKERKKRNSKEKCFRHAYVKRERESLDMGIKWKENERKIWCVYYVIKQKKTRWKNFDKRIMF